MTLRELLDKLDVRYRDIEGEQTIRCPVHSDRTASCSLNLGKELMHCHSCGFAGGVVELYARYYAVPVSEARQAVGGQEKAQPVRKTGSGYRFKLKRRSKPKW